MAPAGRVLFPRVSGARLRCRGEGSGGGGGETDQGRRWGGKGSPDLGEGLISSSHPSGCGGRDPVESEIRSWAGLGRGSSRKVRTALGKSRKYQREAGPEGAGLEMTPLVTPPRREGHKVVAGPQSSGSLSSGRGATRPREVFSGVGPPSSRQGGGLGLEGLSSLEDAVRQGPGLPPTPFASPVLEQPWDFLPRERPRLIHPGAFGGTFLL